MTDEVAQRDSRGRFLPGNRGNRNGNPHRGTSAAFRKMLDPHMPDLLNVTIARAKDGDMEAMRILMDRMYPKLRPIAVQVEVPGLAEAGTLTDKAKAIINAAATGQIGTDNAQELLQALSALANVTAVDELQRQIFFLKHGHDLNELA